MGHFRHFAWCDARWAGLVVVVRRCRRRGARQLYWQRSAARHVGHLGSFFLFPFYFLCSGIFWNFSTCLLLLGLLSFYIKFKLVKVKLAVGISSRKEPLLAPVYTIFSCLHGLSSFLEFLSGFFIARAAKV